MELVGFNQLTSSHLGAFAGIIRFGGDPEVLHLYQNLQMFVPPHVVPHFFPKDLSLDKLASFTGLVLTLV